MVKTRTHDDFFDAGWGEKRRHVAVTLVTAQVLPARTSEFAEDGTRRSVVL
jgi:hypothetical protein